MNSPQKNRKDGIMYDRRAVPPALLHGDRARQIAIGYELRLKDLARLAGVSAQTLYNALSKSHIGRRLQCRIELAIKKPIWSSVSEFQARMRFMKRTGMDPSLASLAALRCFAKERGYSGWSVARTKTDILRLISKNLRRRKTQEER